MIIIRIYDEMAPMKKFFSLPLLCAVLIVAALVMVVSVRSCSNQYKEAPSSAATADEAPPAGH